MFVGISTEAKSMKSKTMINFLQTMKSVIDNFGTMCIKAEERLVICLLEMYEAINKIPN